MRLCALAALAVALAVGLAPVPTHAASPAGGQQAELAAARALFERNLDAIRKRDTAGYLSCYRQSEHLARTGPGGVALG